MVEKGPWKIPFGTIRDIYKMSQKMQKRIPDVLLTADACNGKNGASDDSRWEKKMFPKLFQGTSLEKGAKLIFITFS